MGFGGVDFEWKGPRIVRNENWYVEREIGSVEGEGIFGEDGFKG